MTPPMPKPLLTSLGSVDYHGESGLSVVENPGWQLAAVVHGDTHHGGVKDAMRALPRSIQRTSADTFVRMTGARL